METNTTKTPPAKKVTPLPKKKAEKKNKSLKGLSAFIKAKSKAGIEISGIIKAAIKNGSWPCVTDTPGSVKWFTKVVEQGKKKAKAKEVKDAKAAAKAAKAPPAKKAPKAKAVKAPKAPPAPKAAPALPSTPPVPQTVPGEAQE